jgi:hypothetical protein
MSSSSLLLCFLGGGSFRSLHNLQFPSQARSQSEATCLHDNPAIQEFHSWLRSERRVGQVSGQDGGACCTLKQRGGLPELVDALSNKQIKAVEQRAATASNLHVSQHDSLVQNNAESLITASEDTISNANAVLLAHTPHAAAAHAPLNSCHNAARGSA